MRIRSYAASVAIAAVTAGVCASSASAETITFNVPVNGTVFNDCTTEWVMITGTQHFKVTDNSTVFGLKSQIESNLTGVKGTGLASGVRYVMNDQVSDMQHAEFDPFGNAQMTMENTTNLTRQGETATLMTAGDDLRLHAQTHLTVSNGVPRSEKTDMRADCR